MNPQLYSTASRAATLIALLIAVQTAHAQTMPAQTGSGPIAANAAVTAAPAQGTDAGGDILVTARRTTERLQDIPLSITAQNAERLQNLGVADLETVARVTPSLQFKDFVTTFHGNATLRGLSQVNTANGIGNVGIFLNGIYLQRSYMVDTSLGDFSRIEVVNGPQSALYGQNTFAGAINYVTNEPSKELKANGEVSYGSAGLKSVAAGVGGPIIDGILGARIYVARSVYDGSWENTLAATNPALAGDLKHFGGYKRTAFSGMLKFTPTDKLTVKLFYQNNEREEELRPYYTLDGTVVEDRLVCGPVNATTKRPSLFCGQFPINPSAYRSGVGTPLAAPYSVDQPPTVSKVEVASASVDYRFTNALHASYVYGWTRGQAQEDLGAQSNTVNPTGKTLVTQQHEGGTLHYDSHDVRLAYDDHGPFNGEVSYLHSNATDKFLFVLRQVAPGVPFTRISSDPLYLVPGYALNNYTQTYKVDSVAARASLKLFDEKLVLAGEGRYTITDIAFDDHIARTANPALPLLTSSYKTFSPRGTLEYHFTPNNMVYVSAARGIKAGGFNGYVAGNVTLTTGEQSFGQETNWTYELGSRSTFLDNRLTLDLTAFYVNWDHKQIAITPSNYVPTTLAPGTVPPNIYGTTGKAYSYGLEFVADYHPMRQLSLNLSGSLMNPKYRKGSIAVNYLGLCTGDNCPTNAAIGGNQIERTSKVSFSTGAEYSDVLTGDWNYFGGIDVTYQSKQFTDLVNSTWIAGYALVDLRAGVRNGTWKAWVWGRNVTDKKYINGVFVTASTRANQVSFGELGTYGATLAFNF